MEKIDGKPKQKHLAKFLSKLLLPKAASCSSFSAWDERVASSRSFFLKTSQRTTEVREEEQPELNPQEQMRQMSSH
mgnify:CR=1 FL=1